MFANGQGVAQDYAEAVRLYSLAAEQGNADAQYNLGYMYCEGIGVTGKNKDEAVKWWRIAAGKGHVDARKNLNLNKNCR